MNWIRIFAAFAMMAATIASALAEGGTDETSGTVEATTTADQDKSAFDSASAVAPATNPYRHLDWVTADEIAALPAEQRPTFTGICEAGHADKSLPAWNAPAAASAGSVEKTSRPAAWFFCTSGSSPGS